MLDPQGFALSQFDEQAKARLDYARKIGADLVAVEKLTGLQRAELLKQYSQQGVNELKAWLEQQKYGATSSLSPVDKMVQAQQQFQNLLTTARNGGGTTGLTGAADTLLASSKDVLGGATRAYIEREMFIRAQIQTLANGGGMAGAAAAAAMPTTNADGTVPEWQKPVLYGQAQQTQVLSSSLADISAQIASLTTAINQQNQTRMVS